MARSREDLTAFHNPSFGIGYQASSVCIRKSAGSIMLEQVDGTQIGSALISVLPKERAPVFTIAAVWDFHGHEVPDASSFNLK